MLPPSLCMIPAALLCAAISFLCSVPAAGEVPTTITFLKKAFAHDFLIGTALANENLSDGEKFLLLSNFTNITPENCFKPMALEAREGCLNFNQADRLAAFAAANGLKVNAHTLVWHQSCPPWFFSEGGQPASKTTVLKNLREYIAAVTSHFRGKVESWDVVNEAISDGPEFLKKSPWLDALGEDYLAEAFRAAHLGDPDAKLYYNDYQIEQPKKRLKVLRLIRDLKEKGVRIDGIGIQGHWKLDHVPLKDIEDSLEAFHAEGVDVAITELDLDVVPRKNSSADVGLTETSGDDPYASGCPVEILKREAEQYGQLFALLRKHRDKIKRVTFWGLHDGQSWLNRWPRKRTNHPLLFGRDLSPKPALNAVLNAGTSSDH